MPLAVLTSLCLCVTLLLAALLSLCIYNAVTAVRLHQQVLRADDDPAAPLCSLLIPARDEEDNLRRHLPRLLALRGARVEVLILDDHSRDGTARVAAAFARSAPFPVRVLSGAPLPPGWLGKNWACHQLSQAARGDLLLFCDADVALGPLVVARTAACMAQHRLDALTVLPRQVMGSLAEQAVLPFIMHLPVLGLLPLRLVAEVPSPKLVVANGQWLAFTRAAYAACGGHAAVRDQIVEDMALAVNIKRLRPAPHQRDTTRLRTPYQAWSGAPSGRRLLPVLAVEDLEVRMYQGAAELSQGFAKNLYLLVGGNAATLGLFVLLFSATMLAPLVLPLAPLFTPVPRPLQALLPVPLLLLLALRLLVCRLTRAPLRTVLWHPLGALWLLGLLFQSAVRLTRREVRWKQRLVA